jgi:hypothetical protein
MKHAVTVVPLLIALTLPFATTQESFAARPGVRARPIPSSPTHPGRVGRDGKDERQDAVEDAREDRKDAREDVHETRTDFREDLKR